MDLFQWIDKGGIYVVGVLVVILFAWVSDVNRRTREHSRAIHDQGTAIAVMSAGIEKLVETEKDHSEKLDRVLEHIAEIRGLCNVRRKSGCT